MASQGCLVCRGRAHSYSDTGLPPWPSGIHYPQSYHSSHSMEDQVIPQYNPVNSQLWYPGTNDGLTYSPPDDYAPIHSQRHRHSMNLNTQLHGQCSFHASISCNVSSRGHFHSSKPYDPHSPHSSVSTPSMLLLRICLYHPTLHLSGPGRAERPSTCRHSRPVIIHPGQCATSPTQDSTWSTFVSSEISSPPDPVEPKLRKTRTSWSACQTYTLPAFHMGFVFYEACWLALSASYLRRHAVQTCAL